MTSISSFINTVKQIATENGCAVNTKIDNIVIRITALGEYSSGKSALLNALLGGKFFAESITKETALATNIFYIKEKSYYITRNNDGIESKHRPFIAPFSTTTFGSNIAEIDVYLNADKMAEFAKKDIFFTDLPGSNSGDEAHETIINETLLNSNVVLICVSANQGTISANLLQTVEVLHLNNKNVKFIGITTKSEMPDIHDAGVSHCKLLEQELLKIIPPKSLLACVTTDTRPKKIDDLIQKLHSIDDKYFIEHFFKKNAESYKNELTTRLDSAIAMLNKNRIENISNIENEVKRQIERRNLPQFRFLWFLFDEKKETLNLNNEKDCLDFIKNLSNNELYINLINHQQDTKAAINKLEKQKLAIQSAYELLVS